MIVGTMFFKSQVGSRQYGWTESYVLPSSAPSLPAAIPMLYDLAVRRAQMCGAGVDIPYLRVSDPDTKGDSQVVGGPVAGFAYDPTLGTLNPITATNLTGLRLYNRQLFDAAGADAQLKRDVLSDMPYSAAIVRGEGGTTYTQRRTLWFRGNPDAAQDTAANFPLATGNPVADEWLKKLQLFLSPGLTGWGFRTRKAYTPPFVLVTGAGSVGGAPTFNAAYPALTQGKQFTVTGLKMVNIATGAIYKVPSGPYVVFANTGTLITAVGVAPDLSGFIVQTPGKMKQLEQEAVVFNQFVLRRYAKKNTGGPFDRPIVRSRRKRVNAA